MIVKAWSDGTADYTSGSGLGIRITKKDRNKFFKKSWNFVLIDLGGSSTCKISLTDTFWEDCVELRSQVIGIWLIEKGLAPWKKNSPPSLNLDPVKDNKFVLSYMPDYEKAYSEQAFWNKLSTYATRAGKEIIVDALMLYFCLLDEDTPKRARAIIIPALGYFIAPIDAIPDYIPVAGFSDDLGVLAIAMAVVAVHIKPEHRKKAEEKIKTWFG